MLWENDKNVFCQDGFTYFSQLNFVVAYVCLCCRWTWSLNDMWHLDTFSGCDSTATEYVQRCTGPTRSGSCILRCGMRWCFCLTFCNLVEYVQDILSVAWEDNRIQSVTMCYKLVCQKATNGCATRRLTFKALNELRNADQLRQIRVIGPGGPCSRSLPT